MDNDDKPLEKNGNSENIPYRIRGLEEAKTYPGMSPADIAALDRSIAKLKAKLAEQKAGKKEDEGM